MYKLTKSGNKTAYNQDEYVCDTLEDLALIPKQKAEMGSTVFIIETSQVFMLNSQREWKEI